MCIRDRGYTFEAIRLALASSGVHVSNATVQREVARVTKAASVAQGSGSGCLLYTSDAADERSSVDLGGRRIIKKKKQTISCKDSDNIQKTERNMK